jgi:hypothetical protein
MTNRSTFPTTIDSFIEYAELSASDKTNADRYRVLLMQETRTTAEETELANLKTTLTNKIVSSESINKMNDSIVNLENYFLNSVMADLATLDVGVLRIDLDNHADSTLNPHQVTKSQVGLSNVDNVKQATKSEFDSHVVDFDAHDGNKNNPHNTTASQVGAYSKTETDAKFINGVGQRIEQIEITFFTNGGAYVVDGTSTFSKAFTSTPTIIPAQVSQLVSYADLLIYPYILSTTTTGVSVRLNNKDNGIFSAGLLKMKFIAIGK